MTYHKFAQLLASYPSCGLQTMTLRALYDSEPDHAGVLSVGTGKIWYGKLVGGLKLLSGEELKGSVFGYDIETWLIDVPVYLSW